MNDTAKLAKIDVLTSAVPSVPCKPGCSDCCGPVLMSRLEWKRILKVMGKTEKELAVPEDLTCPMLDRGTHRCGCYEVRPTICRVFGASLHKRLVCPHGCAPAIPLTARDTDELINAVAKIGY